MQSFMILKSAFISVLIIVAIPCKASSIYNESLLNITANNPDSIKRRHDLNFFARMGSERLYTGNWKYRNTKPDNSTENEINPSMRNFLRKDEGKIKIEILSLINTISNYMLKISLSLNDGKYKNNWGSLTMTFDYDTKRPSEIKVANNSLLHSAASESNESSSGKDIKIQEVLNGLKENVEKYYLEDEGEKDYESEAHKNITNEVESVPDTRILNANEEYNNDDLARTVPPENNHTPSNIKYPNNKTIAAEFNSFNYLSSKSESVVKIDDFKFDFGISFLKVKGYLKISELDLDIDFELFQGEPIRNRKIYSYSIFLCIIGMYSFLSSLNLIKKMISSHSECLRYSLHLSFLNISWDFTISILNSLLAFSNPRNYNDFFFPAVIYFVKFALLDSRISFLIWNAQNVAQGISLQDLRKKVIAFYLLLCK